MTVDAAAFLLGLTAMLALILFLFLIGVVGLWRQR